MIQLDYSNCTLKYAQNTSKRTLKGELVCVLLSTDGANDSLDRLFVGRVWRAGASHLVPLQLRVGGKFLGAFLAAEAHLHVNSLHVGAAIVRVVKPLSADLTS